ncbi:MAG TPA: DUF2127 domain-containing protein [Patescibacteria group bacterium]|jgi:uncharacterized membrane protein|nr:DUF2127 domain-containing protein [Patescibacteria group bacterium]
MILKQKHWHTLFEASVVIKAINGTWETISGFALLFISNGFINKALASHQTITSHISSGTKDFAGLYILSHGLINIFLAYHLYRNRLWAFWVSMGFFSGSILYLIYRATSQPSLLLFTLIIFDTFFVFLTWHEFQYRKELVAQTKLAEAK